MQFLDICKRAMAEASSLVGEGHLNMSLDLVKAYVNDGYDEIEAFARWPWSLASGTDTLTAGSAEVTMPADMLQVISVYDTTSNTKLTYMDTRQALVDEYGELTSTGSPTHYYRIGNTWGVWRTPDAANVLKIYYLKTWTDLSSDSDVPIFPSIFHRILVSYAAYRILEHYNASNANQLAEAQAGQRMYKERYEVEKADMLYSHATDDVQDVIQSIDAFEIYAEGY